MKSNIMKIEDDQHEYVVVADRNICYFQIYKISSHITKMITISEVSSQETRNTIRSLAVINHDWVNQWKFCDAGLHKYVYCDALSIGYVIEMPEGISYDNLPLEHVQDCCEYFKEIIFNQTLLKLNSSLDSVKGQFGMTQEKLNILLVNASQIEAVVKLGFSIESLCLHSLSPQRLQSILSSPLQLADALRFITIDQVLGSIHQPLMIPEIPRQSSALPLIHDGVSSVKKEDPFIEFMKSKGHDLIHLMDQGRVSQSFLHELCVHETIIREWIGQGMTLQDLLQIPENRLKYVLLNYSKLRPALSFVSIFEMLDLKAPPLQTFSYLSYLTTPVTTLVHAVTGKLGYY